MSRMYSYIWQRILIAILVNCSPEFTSDRSPALDTTADEIAEILRDQSWAREATPLPEPATFSALVPSVEMIMLSDQITIFLDTDGDGLNDRQDPCPLDVDHTRITKYQDLDHDGLVVPSPEPRCRGDVAYPYAAEDLSFYQRDHPDPDDTVAVTAWDELGYVIEADWGIDFDQSSDLGDTEPSYLIANPRQWLDFAANCGSKVTTTCSVNVVIVADLDFAVLDGKHSDMIAGDGAYTTSDLDDLVSSTDGAEPYSGSVSSLDRSIRNLHIDRDAENTGVFVRVDNAQFDNFDFFGSINGHRKQAIGFIARAEGRVLIKDIAFDGTVTGGDAVGSMIGLATGSTEEVLISTTHARGRIQGRSDVGGLVGRSENDFVARQVYNLATVVAQDGRAAGIIGMARGRGSASMVFNSGAVSATQHAAGIVTSSSDHPLGIWLTKTFNTGAVTSVGPGTQAAGIFVDTATSGSKFNLRSAYNAGKVSALSRWSSSYGIAKNQAGNLDARSAAMYFVADDSHGDGIGTGITRHTRNQERSYVSFFFGLGRG